MPARAVAAVEAALRGIAAFCLAAMAAPVVAEVGLRHPGGGTPAFTEEMARHAMIRMALLAAAVAVREGTHIRVDFVPLLPAARVPRLGRALEAALDVVTPTVALTLAWQGLDMMAFGHEARSEGLRLGLSYPYAVVPASFALASLFAVARLAVRR